MSGWIFKGYQCRPDGPPPTYRWSFAKPVRVGRYAYRYLVLDPIHEPCNERRSVLQKRAIAKAERRLRRV